MENFQFGFHLAGFHLMTPLITSVEPIQVTIQTDQVLHFTVLFLLWLKFEIRLLQKFYNFSHLNIGPL